MYFKAKKKEKNDNMSRLPTSTIYMDNIFYFHKIIIEIHVFYYFNKSKEVKS